MQARTIVEVTVANRGNLPWLNAQGNMAWKDAIISNPPQNHCCCNPGSTVNNDRRWLVVLRVEQLNGISSQVRGRGMDHGFSTG